MQTLRHEAPRPGLRAPRLELPTVGGDTWSLHDQRPERFTMVVFYRGLHCPVCKSYLEGLELRLEKFAARGVDVVAVSMDGEARAKRAKDQWDIFELTVAYGLPEEEALNWGLYISQAITDAETRRFSEPGLFLIDRQKLIHYVAINSMPFGRPGLDEMLDAVAFINDEGYPPRGRAA